MSKNRQTLTRAPCIWCLQLRTKSKEHIVPEVLGGPKELRLKRGEVCKVCNNGRLSYLDGVLGESFDFMRMHAGQPGKKGKKPRITGRSNLRGGPGDHGEPEFHINLEKHAVQSVKYGMIPARSGSYRDVDGSFERIGDTVKVQMSLTIGAHPDFSRAIHKVAFERLAQIWPWESLLESRFDPVRAYVMDGRGYREVIGFMPDQWIYHHFFPGSVWTNTAGDPSLHFALCGLPLWVYLGPDQQAVQDLKNMALGWFGNSGWTVFPPPVSS